MIPRFSTGAIRIKPFGLYTVKEWDEKKNNNMARIK
jgi:hypothetical protein